MINPDVDLFISPCYHCLTMAEALKGEKMVCLRPLEAEDREQFIKDNQYAFKYGALEEFGTRDEHFEEDGEIISRKTIEDSIDNGVAYRIVKDGQYVGGLVLKTNGECGELELLFTSPNVHSKGIGYAAWCEVERMYPQVKEWTTCTPYFEQRNIHFYVNRCGFHIVEFFNKHHPDLNHPDSEADCPEDSDNGDGMFLFKKRMRDDTFFASHSDETIRFAERRLKIIAIFSFIVSPLLAWGSVIASDETAVFASLSRLIWYSGDPWRILISMIAMFLPMLFSFFLALSLNEMSKKSINLCKILMVISCCILYIGAMEIMPSDGTSMTKQNVWHGILSFGGMLLIFLTYCLYTVLNSHEDRDGSFLITCLLIFTVISGAFAILNVFDDNSYVIASAVSELYILTMFNIIGYMTYYLAFRKVKAIEDYHKSH